jgi:hypothetical protein
MRWWRRLGPLGGILYVGGVHGRLLITWATAGVLGLVLVNYLKEYEIGRGVAKAEAYNMPMYVMDGILLLGLVAKLLIRPVHEKHHINDEFDELDGAFPREES